MKKIIVFFIAALLLAGCSSSVQSSNPPKMMLKIDGKSYQTEQGTYCWAGKCVDKVSPEEIMAGKGTIKVAPNEEIQLIMNDKPNQIEAYLSSFKDDLPTDVPMKDLRFYAPSEPGIYYYAASFGWVATNLNSDGDSSYVFAIEVQ